MQKYNKSLIIPCKEEGESFITILKRFEENIKEDTEILVVLDSKKDPTYKYLSEYASEAKIIINPNEGVAGAINFGISSG